MPIKIFILLWFTICCLTNNGVAQGKTDSTVYNVISFTGLYGLGTFSEKTTQTKGFFYGFESAYQLSDWSADWIQMLQVKYIDFSLSYRNFHDVYLIDRPAAPGFIGNSYTALSRIEMSLFHIGSSNFLLTPGFGFTYVTKTFYTTYDPLIGSHINFSAELGFKTVLPIVTGTKIAIGFELFHFSNAAFKLPNQGVNSLSASLGLVQDIGGPKYDRKILLLDTSNKGSFDLGIGIGHRGLIQVYAQRLSPADSIKQAHATSHLNNIGMYAGYNYRLNPLISLKLATDIIYYTTVYNYINYLTTVQEYGTSKDRFSVGVSLGGDIWLGRLAFEANYGYYIHLKYATTPIYFYYIFGAKYLTAPWVAVEGKIYLHETQAQYANFGFLFNIH
jgi:hypothetical protein